MSIINWEGGEDEEGRKRNRKVHATPDTVKKREREPNQQRTLNKLPPELRCRSFVDNHWLSMRVGAQTCKNVYATCAYSDWAPILHATVAGWVRGEEVRSLHCDEDCYLPLFKVFFKKKREKINFAVQQFFLSADFTWRYNYSSHPKKKVEIYVVLVPLFTFLHLPPPQTGRN